MPSKAQTVDPLFKHFDAGGGADFGMVFGGHDRKSKKERVAPDTVGSGAADTYRFGYERFDGSEFKATNFRDSHFGRQSFSDSLHAEHAEFRTQLHMDSLGHANDYRRHQDCADCIRRLQTLPLSDLLGDWVPDKADPANNGGFATSPDNGAPVPYHLNGFPDLQRKYPWEAEP